MNYIVLDTEFNQPTPKHFNPKYTIPINQRCPFEIIEIGAVKLDDTFKQIDTFRSYIKPNIYKRMNPIISKKIKITNNDLKYGFEFNRVIKYFKRWIGNDYIICTWSDNDIRELLKNCRYYNLDTKWFQRYIDVQYELSKIMNNEIISLKRATDLYNLECCSELHHALNDSIRTCEILQIIAGKTNLTYHTTENIKI